MKPIEVEAEYGGVTFRVTGSYNGAVASLITADPYDSIEGNDSYIEDLEIWIGGEEITGLLKDGVIVEVEGAAITAWEEGERGSYDEATERKIDEARGK